MRGLAAVGLVAVGCGGSTYTPGELVRDTPSGAGVRRGECIDVQVTRTRDEAVVPGWPVLVYRIGNRCRSPVRVDLGAVRVAAGSASGMIALPLHDPRSEVAAATLDGRQQLEEALAYELPPDTPAGRVCLALDALANGLSAEPLCLDEREAFAP